MPIPTRSGSAMHQYNSTMATHAGRQLIAQSGNGIAVSMNAAMKLAR
jgi:hypothetical protein